MATFRKRGDKWEYRVSFKDPFTLKYKIKSKSGFKTKKEAQKAAAEQEKQIAAGFEFDTETMSLEQFLFSWLHEYKKTPLERIHMNSTNETSRIIFFLTSKTSRLQILNLLCIKNSLTF